MTAHYKNDDEIEALVADFEACAIAKDGFSHRSHLAVATYYLHTSTPDRALEKMREGLLRFLAYHEIDLATYSEAVTRAWLNEIQKVLDEFDRDAHIGADREAHVGAELRVRPTLVALTNTVIERLSNFVIPVPR
ncbi:MAG TPA: hypothetical protein VIW64_05785 [Pyrinomonadaceae bacterium]|jgi:hypothetical protein